jgi:hypothetical protein
MDKIAGCSAMPRAISSSASSLPPGRSGLGIAQRLGTEGTDPVAAKQSEREPAVCRYWLDPGQTLTPARFSACGPLRVGAALGGCANSSRLFAPPIWVTPTSGISCYAAFVGRPKPIRASSPEPKSHNVEGTGTATGPGSDENALL